MKKILKNPIFNLFKKLSKIDRKSTQTQCGATVVYSADIKTYSGVVITRYYNFDNIARNWGQSYEFLLKAPGYNTRNERLSISISRDDLVKIKLLIDEALLDDSGINE